MSHHHYHTCRSNIGRHCRIQTVDGRVYSGRIADVTRDHVVIEPVGRTISSDDHNVKASAAVSSTQKESGEPIWWYYGGFRRPFIVPLAAIAGITLIGLSATRPYGYWW